MSIDVSAAAGAIAYAGQTRRDLAEAEARGWTVTVESRWHIMIWRRPPKPYSKADNVADPARGHLLGSWLDGPSWSIDHLARCLRAEMAVLDRWPAGWETQRLTAALAAAGKDGKA